MTPKETQAFASELRQISAFEVRENFEPSIQPDPIKRAMAVTELERRRQARAPHTIRDSIPLRVVSWLLLGSLVAAAAYWKFF